MLSAGTASIVTEKNSFRHRYQLPQDTNILNHCLPACLSLRHPWCMQNAPGFWNSNPVVNVHNTRHYYDANSCYCSLPQTLQYFQVIFDPSYILDPRDSRKCQPMLYTCLLLSSASLDRTMLCCEKPTSVTDTPQLVLWHTIAWHKFLTSMVSLTFPSSLRWTSQKKTWNGAILPCTSTSSLTPVHFDIPHGWQK